MKNGYSIGVICSFLLFQCLFVACLTEPMTAERLINECAQAMGGVEKIESLKTIHITENWPDHGTLCTEIKRPNHIRLGKNLVFDGERGCYLERKGADGAMLEPKLVPQEDWNHFEVDVAWYFPAFFDHSAEYRGKEILDGIETYKLKVTLPLGAAMTYNLDAQTYLVCKATSHITVEGKTRLSEREYSAFKEVEGILYPHAYTYPARDGETVLTATVTNLEFNIQYDDGWFDVPIETNNE
jgi:hypothetical protein